MFPEGLLRFVNLYLNSGIREKIEKSCNNFGVDTRYLYYNRLLDSFLSTEFKDQSLYKRVSDLPREEVLRAIKALDYLLGMSPRNGNEYLLNVYRRRFFNKN
jgi:hypothetical protein